MGPGKADSTAWAVNGDSIFFNLLGYFIITMYLYKLYLIQFYISMLKSIYFMRKKN